MSQVDAEAQLDAFIARYAPEIAAQATEVLAKMRARLPGAMQLVYDNYNALVIGFCPTERASDAVFSIALYPKWVTLFFLQGAALPDPDGLLRGDGAVAKQIRLEGPETLDRQEVQALMRTALEHATVPLDPTQPGMLVIKSISAKQRPRRPSGGV